jgi:3-oxoacyl-[acyl-carrier protein] reductase
MFVKKNILITGCSRGIGKSLVEKFLLQGANLICCVRKNSNDFKNFIKKNKNSSNVLQILEFDLKDEEEMKKSIKFIYENKINIDILINNAGMPQGSIFEMTPIKLIKEVFEINFFSQLKLVQLLLKSLKQSKDGVIINIGSVSGLEPLRGNISYGTSKAALMFSTQILAEELKNYNIRVNSFAPSLTNTNMMSLMDEKSKKKLMKLSKIEKPYSVNEVAEKILILASEKFTNINGKIFTMKDFNG